MSLTHIIGYIIVCILLFGCGRSVYILYFMKPAKNQEEKMQIGCLFFVMLILAGFFAWLFGL